MLRTRDQTDISLPSRSSDNPRASPSNHHPQASKGQSRPWLPNLVSAGHSHGQDHSSHAVSPRPVPSSSATKPNQTDSQPSSATSSAPSQHAEPKTVSGTSATKLSPPSVTVHNRESIEPSSSGRRDSRPAIAGSAGAFLPISLDRGDGCGEGEQLQVAGTVLSGDGLSKGLLRSRKML